jgi:hypothetical protein
MKLLFQKTTLSLSIEEKRWIENMFSFLLSDVELEGVNATVLEVLSTIVNWGSPKIATAGIEQEITRKISQASISALPESITLTEAAKLFDVNAATLRRACWQGKLKGNKRGKTWFVKIGDLEDYLFWTKQIRE